MDVTDKIERLEAFEERAGVRLEALSADFQGHSGWQGKDVVHVMGELHSTSSDMHLSVTTEICVAVYDNQGGVIGTAGKEIKPEDFFGFEVFKVSVYCPDGSEVGKVRLLVLQ